MISDINFTFQAIGALSGRVCVPGGAEGVPGPLPALHRPRRPPPLHERDGLRTTAERGL